MEPSSREFHFDLDGRIIPEERYVTTHYVFQNFLIADSVEGLEQKWNSDRNHERREFLVSNNEMLVSPEIKVLLYVSKAFYHFFIDSLTLILKLNKEHPGVRLILYLDKYEPNKNYDKLLNFLFELLDHLNVKYTTIPTSPGYDFAPVYKFSNFIAVDENVNIHNEMSLLDVKYAADLIIDYLIRKTTGETSEVVPRPRPTKKVYITRGGLGSNVGFVDENYSGYKDDVRLYDEHKLQEVLIENGYEVIHPESKFETIEEQILFMLEVETLCAVTCSGLANVIFMQSDQRVIEVQSEVVQVTGTDPGAKSVDLLIQAIHNFYPPLSFMRGATHFSIPTNRDPEVAIEKMKAAGLIK